MSYRINVHVKEYSCVKSVRYNWIVWDFLLNSVEQYFDLIISLNFIMLDDQNDKYSKSIYKVQTQRDERMRVNLITSHSQQK